MAFVIHLSCTDSNTLGMEAIRARVTQGCLSDLSDITSCALQHATVVSDMLNMVLQQRINYQSTNIKPIQWFGTRCPGFELQSQRSAKTGRQIKGSGSTPGVGMNAVCHSAVSWGMDKHLQTVVGCITNAGVLLAIRCNLPLCSVLGTSPNAFK